MKLLTLIITLTLLISCDQKGTIKMSELPTNWKEIDSVQEEQIYDLPPQSEDKSRLAFYGMLDENKGYKVYDIPANTEISQIIKVFKVGYHGASTYLLNPQEVNSKVAKYAESINRIIPSEVVFADSAGLKLKFKRQINSKEFEQIKALFPKESLIEDGMEIYMDEWFVESIKENSIIDQNLIHFWWD